MMDDTLYLHSMNAIKKAEQEHIITHNNAAMLMDEAGKKIADAVTHYYPKQRQWVIVAGPGNNGGDGLVAARYLHEQGYDVTVMYLDDTPPVNMHARQAYDAYKNIKGRMMPLDKEYVISHQCGVIDALFGINFHSELPIVYQEFCRYINQYASMNVIAIDTPSGINASGQACPIALQANYTISFIAPKSALYHSDGRYYSGDIIIEPLADIAITDSAVRLNSPAIWQQYYPKPAIDTHKYKRGMALIYGNHTMPGAAILAVGAARRMGAGLVKVATRKGYEDIFYHHNPGAIIEGFHDSSSLAAMIDDGHHMAFLLGPGSGINIGLRDRIYQSCQHGIPLILDADALRIISYDIKHFADIIPKDTSYSPILTPHEGEFIDLFGDDIAAMDRVDGTLKAAHITQSIIVRKGYSTIIASPQGDAIINNNDSPYLATAGSGDVLAGMITGLLAQKMPPLYAAACAVYIHGAIGKTCGMGMIAEDIVTAIPRHLQTIMRG